MIDPSETCSSGSVNLVVVADDLTGAADSVAPFCGFAERVRLCLTPTECEYTGSVIGITTASRGLSVHAAIPRLERVLDTLQHSEADIFVKIDSMLRGHVGMTLNRISARLDPADWMLFCPALPAQGRFVIDGRLHFRNAATGPCLTELLPKSIDNRSLSLSEIRKGSSSLAALMVSAYLGGTRCFTGDAGTDEDLFTLVSAAQDLPGSCIPVGSGGLASALATLASGGPPPKRTIGLPHGDGAIIVGSRNRAARTQMERVLAHYGASELLDRDGVAAPSPMRFAGPHGDVVILAPPLWSGATPPSRIQELAVEEHLTLRALEVLLESTPKWIAIIGGDTGASILQALEINTLDVRGELQPGLVLASPVNESYRDLVIVLRSGGFGSDAALVEILAETPS